MTDGNARDRIGERIAGYALSMEFDDLDDATIDAASLRLLDTVSAAAAGIESVPYLILRQAGAEPVTTGGARIIGSGSKVAAEMAAFVNAATSRFAELNDVYHGLDSAGGHPSDVVMPCLAAAESCAASGKQLVAMLVCAYEIYLRLSDAAGPIGFDASSFSAVATAAAAGRAFGLSLSGMRNCVAIAAVGGVALRVSRLGSLSMWKAAAAGDAGRCGLFAARLARAGITGPEMPFEGPDGWTSRVAPRLDRLAHTDFARGGLYKIHESIFKPRACCATTMSAALAGEKVSAELRADDPIHGVVVETYGQAVSRTATGAHCWAPHNRETADHSTPYVVAVALLDGVVGIEQFDDAHLRDMRVRQLLPRISVVEAPEFTKLYATEPVVHRSRVTVTLASGKTVTGESGGEYGDMADFANTDFVVDRFKRTVGSVIGIREAERLVNVVRDLPNVEDVAAISGRLVRDAAE